MKIHFYKLRKGFTLTEVLLAVLIVGILAALVIPAIVTTYQNKVLEKAYDREILAIRGAVDTLPVTENKASFFDTMMYTDSNPGQYSDNSGKFMKKYLRVSKYCGDSNGNCFAPKYYEYKDKDKVVYTPEYDGACAILKNGISICLKPQIGAAGVEGLMDLNGKKGPNVLGNDLHTFSLEPKKRAVISVGTEKVISLNNSPLATSDPCSTCDCDPTLPGCSTTPPPPTEPVCNNPDPAKPSRCCDTASIGNYSDTCCTIDAIYNSKSACKGKIKIRIYNKKSVFACPSESVKNGNTVTITTQCEPHWDTTTLLGFLSTTSGPLIVNQIYIENNTGRDLTFNISGVWTSQKNPGFFTPDNNSTNPTIKSGEKYSLYTYKYISSGVSKNYLYYLTTAKVIEKSSGKVLYSATNNKGLPEETKEVEF